MIRILISAVALLLVQDPPAAEPVEWTFFVNDAHQEDLLFKELPEIEKAFEARAFLKGDRQVVLIRNEKAWEAFWKCKYNRHAKDDVPKIDFSKNLVFYARPTTTFHGTVSHNYAIGMDQAKGIEVASKLCEALCRVRHSNFTVRKMAIPGTPPLVFRHGTEEVSFDLAPRK